MVGPAQLSELNPLLQPFNKPMVLCGLKKQMVELYIPLRTAPSTASLEASPKTPPRNYNLPITTLTACLGRTSDLIILGKVKTSKQITFKKSFIENINELVIKRKYGESGELVVQRFGPTRL